MNGSAFPSLPCRTLLQVFSSPTEKHMHNTVNALLNALMFLKSETPPLAIAAFHVAMVGGIIAASLPARSDQTERDFPFLVGADCSHVGYFEMRGKVYRENSVAVEPFHLLKAGAMPDYVQVGNEITPGMLWPEGRVGGKFETPEQWAKLGRLLKAAIRGIREAAGSAPPKLIIHIDRGGDWKTTRWFFDHLREQNVDFDIIGESCYPFWHGSLQDLKTCLSSKPSDSLSALLKSDKKNDEHPATERAGRRFDRLRRNPAGSVAAAYRFENSRPDFLSRRNRQETGVA